MGNFSIFLFSNLFAAIEKLVLQYEDAASTLVLKLLDSSHCKSVYSTAYVFRLNYIY